jgi:hypothetical protein
MVLVSEDSNEVQSARLRFEHANSVQDAIDKVAKNVPSATVNILPLGGIVLPLFPESMRTKW